MRLEGRSKDKAISEMSAFTERNILARKCTNALVGVLKEITSAHFTELEIDTVISRLLHSFQTRDSYLKILSYSFIRNIADLSSGSFVAINALINNITARKDGLRAEALKLLLQITPEQMLEDCSKYVHQSLIETEYHTLNTIVPVLIFLSNPSLSEWFSSYGWMQGLKSSGAFGNAIILMSQIRPQDEREIVNVIGKSPHLYSRGISAVHVVRYLSAHLSNPTALKIFSQFLALDESDPAPFIEALRHVHLMNNAVGALDAQVIGGIKKLLKSNNSVVKIATLRTIDTLSVHYKQKLSALRGMIEEMLADSSTVALLAMSILLKVGSDKTAGKIAETLPKLLNELGETQKVSIIESVTGMCDRFKGTSWDELLKKALTAQGSCSYKVKIVQNIAKIRNVTEDEELKRSLEGMLCNYIEDSSYPRVTVEILGNLIDKKSSEHTGSLLNRIILDNENVQPAVNLSLAVDDCTHPLHVLFSAGASTAVLKDNTEIDRMVIEKLQEDADIFIEKREENALESKFNSVQLHASNRIVLNRKESEFEISVVKNMFNEFIVLQYKITSKIDLVLEEGRLRVFMNENCIGDEVIYLRGRDTTEISIKVPASDYMEVCGAEVSSTFGYSVYDDRDYEVGEVRLNDFEIEISDFIAPGGDAAEIREEDPLVKEFKFSMPVDEVIKELKNLFRMEVQEEEDGNLQWTGVFMHTGESVLIKATVKKDKSTSTKAKIRIFCKSEEIKQLLIDLIN
ncbi:coatomer subunit gamma [Nematocida minor]|uniref:coatomer subunit gamma n=1 Tax=Nematocida minor TaxID=1912983 RepID=UPI00221E5EF1|nr:coatomer subunit gamma [Nematocida minor]KAI5192905.1 coatomer subunit gamma [Nematocida minor]